MERKGGLPPRVGIPSNIPDSWTIPQRLSSMGCTGSMSVFDEGVILRAHRFRAEMAGYRLERGHYMDREHDRADRWYVVPASRTGCDGRRPVGVGVPHEPRCGRGGRAACQRTGAADAWAHGSG